MSAVCVDVDVDTAGSGGESVGVDVDVDVDTAGSGGESVGVWMWMWILQEVVVSRWVSKKERENARHLLIP